MWKHWNKRPWGQAFSQQRFLPERWAWKQTGPPLAPPIWLLIFENFGFNFHSVSFRKVTTFTVSQDIKGPRYVTCQDPILLLFTSVPDFLGHSAALRRPSPPHMVSISEDVYLWLPALPKKGFKTQQNGQKFQHIDVLPLCPGVPNDC